MQGLRALKAEFGDMLQFDKTLDGALDATMPVGKSTQELQKYENLQAWGDDWGTPFYSTDKSPLYPIYQQRSLQKPQNQTEKQLLEKPEEFTLKRLFAASGQNVSAGYMLFQTRHPLLVWTVPVPQFDGQSRAYSHESDETDIDANSDEDLLPDNQPSGQGVPPTSRTSIEGPRSGRLHVAGVLMLNCIVPYVVRFRMHGRCPGRACVTRYAPKPM